MTAREDILSWIRARGAVRADPGVVGRGSHGSVAPADRLQRFVERAMRESAQVIDVGSESGAPVAVAGYLAARLLAPRVALAPDVALLGLDWSSAGLETGPTNARGTEGVTVVTTCLAAVADLGVVACTFASSAEPATVFRAETHVVLVRRAQVVPALGDLWVRLRNECGDAWPASINLLAGPSRTADIELELQIGVHGPLHMLIVLVD